ncbi:tyrosine-type recombinase/integrase [Vreelandella titanicae]
MTRAHAARGAEKLRKQGALARAVQVHLKSKKLSRPTSIARIWPSLPPISSCSCLEIAVNTGCRRGELYNLEWSWVDLTRGRELIALRAEHTTSGKPRAVALNEPAVMAIKRRAGVRRMHWVANGCLPRRVVNRLSHYAQGLARQQSESSLLICGYTTCAISQHLGQCAMVFHWR